MFDTAILYKTVTTSTAIAVANRLCDRRNQLHRFQLGNRRVLAFKPNVHIAGLKYIALLRQPDARFVNLRLSFSLNGLCGQPDDQLFLPSRANKKLLVASFSQMVQAIGLKIGSKISRWIVRRLDFAVDIATPHADFYVRSMRKAKLPYRYGLHCAKAGSLYSGTKKRQTICNYYNKTQERQAKGISFATDDGVPVMRIEVQVNSTRKLREISKRHGLPVERSLLDFLRLEIAQDVILRHLKNHGLVGDYVSMAEAKRVMSASRMQGRTKEKVVSFMQMATDYQTLNSVCLQYEADTGKKSTDLIRHIRELGINPVTIPFRDRVQRLPGISELVEEVFAAATPLDRVEAEKLVPVLRKDGKDDTLRPAQLYATPLPVSADIAPLLGAQSNIRGATLWIGGCLPGNHKILVRPVLARGRVKPVCRLAANAAKGQLLYYRGPPERVVAANNNSAC